MVQEGAKKMKNQKSVTCEVHGYLDYVKPYQIAFNSVNDLRLILRGELGPGGISDTAADLGDIALAIYMIEKQMKGNKRTNPPCNIHLSMAVRNPKAWTKKAICVLQEILLLLGNAKWDIDIKGGLTNRKPAFLVTTDKKIEQIVLFSGGMDSTCGAMTIKTPDAKEKTALVSFYTRQKTLQQSLVNSMGFTTHIQWGKEWDLRTGRGKSFYYRSLLFLSLAAIVAESWGAKKIIQFENGVLASAIPPSPAWRMTKHAHPELHLKMAGLLQELFGGDWNVTNPFLLKTKKECYLDAAESVGEKQAEQAIKQTETCWFLYSNRVAGGKKKPNTPCGICIPCIVRQTAFSKDKPTWDLTKDANKNNDRIGINFRSYYGFVEQILKTENSPHEFYRILPSPGRQLIGVTPELTLTNLHSLFCKFAKEFMDTYQEQ